LENKKALQKWGCNSTSWGMDDTAFVLLNQ